MAPTPMMAPWPGISRGTSTVPMVPGLVSESHAGKVFSGQLAVAGPAYVSS